MNPDGEQLRVTVLTSSPEVDALRDGWDALVATSADASPFLSHAWAATWWKHFGGRDALRVVAVWSGDELVGLAPLLRWKLGVGPMAICGFVGIGQETADYGGMLLGEDPFSVAPVLLGAIEDEMGARPSSLTLTRLNPSGDTLPAVERWFLGSDRRARWSLVKVSEEAYPFRRVGPESHERLGKSLKRNDVRRRLRRLSEHHEVTLDVHETGQAADRLDEFLELHDRRWADKPGTSTGPFSTSRGRAFLRDVSAELDRLGWLRISFVRVDGKPIAARYGTAVGGVYSGWKSGWDPDYRSFGPGHLIVGMLLQHFEDEGEITRFDFMRGAGPHKDAWSEASPAVGYWQLHPTGWRGAMTRPVGRLVARKRYRTRFA